MPSDHRLRSNRAWLAPKDWRPDVRSWWTTDNGFLTSISAPRKSISRRPVIPHVRAPRHSATLLGVASAVAMGYCVCVFWGFLATKTRTRIDIEIWLDRGMAENQSEKSARIQSRRDALLCFCDDAGPENAGINHRDFRLAVWERPDLSFGDLCGALNVGTKCTACMLNVESAYFDAYKSRPANFVAALETVAARHPTRPNGGPRSVKETLYSVVDGMVPLQPRIAMQIFPVIAARNLRTVLTMSNQFPAAIGARSAQFDCRIERDDQGTLVESSTFGLASGENIDIDVSAPLAAKRGKSEIVSGGCWVYQKPTARGSVGSTRPHFKLVGRRGVSAVHTQVTNSAIGSHLLSRANFGLLLAQIHQMRQSSDKSLWPPPLMRINRWVVRGA